jgi:hypothetical protein
MAAIGHVFTISRGAEMLGDDEGWLYELSIDMFPEDGSTCLWSWRRRGNSLYRLWRRIPDGQRLPSSATPIVGRATGLCTRATALPCVEWTQDWAQSDAYLGNAGLNLQTAKW